MRAWESVKPGNVETLEERTIYLGMSQLRGILNPNISREEEQAAWDQYHQAAMESITERAKALEAANRKLVLSPEAVKALGPVSSEQAWGQITNMLRHVLEEYRETGEDLMKKTASDLPGDLESLVGDMETPGAYPRYPRSITCWSPLRI